MDPTLMTRGTAEFPAEIGESLFEGTRGGAGGYFLPITPSSELTVRICPDRWRYELDMCQCAVVEHYGPVGK